MNNYYNIQITGQANEEQLMRGIYLAMINVTQVPHLVFVVDGKCFSLSVKGPAVDGDLRSLLRAINQRSIESIFVKLTVPGIFTLLQFASETRKCVLAYSRVDIGAVTCLAPIKDVCSNVYGMDVSGVSFIYELLPLLKKKHFVEGYYHLDLESYLQQGEFLFRKYTMEDISAEIRKASLTV